MNDDLRGINFVAICSVVEAVQVPLLPSSMTAFVRWLADKDIPHRTETAGERMRLYVGLRFDRAWPGDYVVETRDGLAYVMAEALFNALFREVEE
jgi:hypothetical protein